MQVPGAIIFVNDSVNLATTSVLPTDTGVEPGGLVPNISTSVIQGIDTQLQINETISLAEFNARVAADPNYPRVVHLQRLRILVILADFQDVTNRHLADIVLFVKQGIASVEKCKFGPPGFSVDVQRLNIFNLFYSAKHSGSTVFCFPCFPEPEHCPPTFPPPICPPQIQTAENPRPPERPFHGHPEGLGDLELYGVEAMEFQHGAKNGVFGDEHEHHHNHIGLPDDDACCVDKDIEIKAGTV